MKTLIKICLLSLALMAHGAFAADLTTAKQQGLIGEQNNGYLGLVRADAPADVKALVADVNAQRKNQFAQIAAKRKVRRTQRTGLPRMPISGTAIRAAVAPMNQTKPR